MLGVSLGALVVSGIVQPAYAQTAQPSGATATMATRSLLAARQVPARTSKQPAQVSAVRFSGILGVASSDAMSASSAGLNSAMLQVSWAQFQPQNSGSYSTSYAAQLRTQIAAFKNAGLNVVLDPGLQYAPTWVFALDSGTRFKNQYGDVRVATPASGENVPDAINDGAVRKAQSTYISLLAQGLGSSTFSIVRAGGSLTGELRYPSGSYNGHSNSYWAYSSGPSSLFPVPSYRPGISTADSTAARVFLEDYLNRIANYQSFLVDVLRNAFNADLTVMYPSYGVRPGDEDAAVKVGIVSNTIRASELQQGVDFARLVPILRKASSATSTKRVIAYSTWIDGPSFGATPTTIDPVGYLAYLCSPLGIPVAGENTASSANDPAAMRTALARVTQYGLVGLLWFGGSDLLTGGSGSMAVQLATGLHE